MSAEYNALSAKRDFDAAEKALNPYRTAREYILNAKADYIKKRTKARSRKKALENTFAELEPYDFNEDDIREAYGYETITENEYYRLMDMLEAYQSQKEKDKNAVFSNDVTKVFDIAIGAVNQEINKLLSKQEEARCQYNEALRRLEEESGTDYSDRRL